MGIFNFNRHNKAARMQTNNLIQSAGNAIQKIWAKAPRRDAMQMPEYAHVSPRLDGIGVIARAVAGTPFAIYDKFDLRKNGDSANALIDHEIIDLLEKPIRRYPEIDGYALFYMTCALVELTGECIWVKIRSPSGKVIELNPVPKAWIMTTPTAGNPNYLVTPFGVSSARALSIPVDDVILFKYTDLVDPYGRGRGSAEPLGQELQTDEYMSTMQSNFAFNDATPPFLLSVPGMPKDQADALKESWMQKLGGFMHRREPAIVGFEAKVQQLAMTPVEMDMTESRRFIREEFYQHYQIPPEIYGNIQNSNKACYSSDTECLTRDGWKYHDRLTMDDEIATWNEESGKLEYHRPSQIVRYDYTGEMHHWKNKNVDVLVTPDHRMFTQTQFEGDFEIKRSFELADKKLMQKWRATGGLYSGSLNDVIIPKVKYVGYGVKGDEPEGDAYHIDPITFAPFLGFYISEGSLEAALPNSTRYGKAFGIKICQNAGSISDKIKQSIIDLGMGNASYTYCGPDAKRLHKYETHGISNKSLHAWLSENVGNGCHNKKIPRCVFDWPAEAQRAMFDAMMLGDGSKKQPRVKSKADYADQYYATTSKQLANDVQQLCMQLGLRCSCRMHNKNRADTYILNISSKQFYFVSTSGIGTGKHCSVSPITKEQYSGIVWCLEVPSHVFFTRRLGKVACHGNTIQSAEYLFYKNVLNNRYRFFERVITNQLVTTEFDKNLVFRFEETVPEDDDFRLEVMSAGLTGGVVLVDEWRKAFKLPPLPNGKGKVFLRGFSTYEVPLDGVASEPAKPEGTTEEIPDDKPTDEEAKSIIAVHILDDEPIIIKEGNETHTKYSEDQPRDESGRFGSGGGDSAGESTDFAAYTERNYSDIASNVSEKQLQANLVYANTGYSDMNRVARGDTENMSDSDISKVKGYNKQLNGYIKGNTLPEDAVLSRGFSVPKGVTLKEGAILENKGFSSFTSDKETAVNFSGGNKDSVIITVRAAAGSNFAPALRSIGGKVGLNTKESEFIGATGMKFRVVEEKGTVDHFSGRKIKEYEVEIYE